MRFPFTFIGVLTFGIGVWVLLYLATHPGLDTFSRDLGAGTAVVCLGFGVYVLVRRVIRGPQH